MSIDSADFKAALGNLAAGVSVVTAISNKEPIGITISSLTSLSLTPPLILFCLDKKSKHRAGFATRKKIAVNILSHAQKNIAQLFAGSEKKIWDQVAFTENHHNLRTLNHALAALHCTITKHHTIGDHIIIIARVDALASLDKHGAPLLYFRRHYHMLGDINT